MNYLIARHSPADPAAANLQQFFTWFLEEAGIRPLAEVVEAESGETLRGWRVWGFAHGRARYFGLAPDLGVSQDVLGGITVEEASRGGGRRVRVRLSASGHLFEVRSGRHLGEGDTVEDLLEPTTTRLYAVLPYRPAALHLDLESGLVRARLDIPENVEPVEHLFRFDLLDSKGDRLLDAGANVAARGGRAEWRPTQAPPPGGRFACRDLASGLCAEVPLVYTDA